MYLGASEDSIIKMIINIIYILMNDQIKFIKDYLKYLDQMMKITSLY